MRNKTPSLIALICIMVYVSAVISGAFRIYAGVDGQRKKARRELDSLQSLIAQDGGDLSSGALGERLRAAVAEFQVLEGIIITGSQGELTFERERGGLIRREGESSRFIPRFGYAALKARQVELSGSRNAVIHSMINTIDYAYTIRVLRQSLLAILVGLLLSFLNMILSATSRSRNPLADDDEEGEEKWEAPAPRKAAAAKAPVPAGLAPGGAAESPGDDFDSFLKDTSGDDDFDLPGLDDASFPGFGGDKAEAAGPAQDSASQSGLDRESHTRERLEAELRRAPKQDLAVLIMECGGGDEERYKKIAREAARFFAPRDAHCFERGDRGISVILPKTDLTAGMAQAEEFHGRILNEYAGNFPSRNDLRIGISSRTGRDVEAARLLLEAGKALEKTKGEPGSPIIAFKIDPKKYREFMKKTAAG
ncbi:MAG: hypothetical protein LBG84_00525 [Treponema sp.]|jgi:hypothetical protein|nr:hypothetical protein [Treponema sp.]